MRIRTSAFLVFLCIFLIYSCNKNLSSSSSMPSTGLCSLLVQLKTLNPQKLLSALLTYVSPLHKHPEKCFGFAVRRTWSQIQFLPFGNIKDIDCISSPSSFLPAHGFPWGSGNHPAPRVMSLDGNTNVGLMPFPSQARTMTVQDLSLEKGVESDKNVWSSPFIPTETSDKMCE